MRTVGGIDGVPSVVPITKGVVEIATSVLASLYNCSLTHVYVAQVHDDFFNNIYGVSLLQFTQWSQVALSLIHI